MPTSRSSSRSSSSISCGQQQPQQQQHQSQRPASMSMEPTVGLQSSSSSSMMMSMSMDPNDGRGDEIHPCPPGFHPMAHTPPPQQQLQQQQQQSLYHHQQQQPQRPHERPPPPPQQLQHQFQTQPRPPRKAPSRSGSTASLFAAPFASLSRRLGAKHKTKPMPLPATTTTTTVSTANSVGSSSRMSTPVEFPLHSGHAAVQHSSGVGGGSGSRSTTPASSTMYSTFPRIHSSSSSTSTPSTPSGRTPFINQLLGVGGGASRGSRHHRSGGGGGTESIYSNSGGCINGGGTVEGIYSGHSSIYGGVSHPQCPSPGLSYSSSSRLSSNGGGHPPMMMTEVLDEPVEEEGAGERVTWEYHHVTMNRVPGYGFGIAVSGGRDNPHFANGDPSIAISDVIKGGPAEGKLLTNDRVMSVNGVSLENVDYGTAVSVLRDSGAAVNLVVKRRIVLGTFHEAQTFKVTLTKSKKKDDFGVILGSRLYLKELTNRALIDGHGNGHSPVFQEGDVVLKINSTPTEGMSLKEARKLMESCKDKLQLTVRRETAPPSAAAMTAGGAVGGGPVGPMTSPGQHHPYDPMYGATGGGGKEGPSGHYNGGGGGGGNYSDRPNYCNQNLYVQPPTRGGSVDYRNPLTPQPPLPPPVNANGTYDDKNGRLTGRSRGPIMDVSLSQLDHSHGNHMNGTGDGGDIDAPPRPPPPRSEEGYYSSRAPEPVKPPPTLEPRFISFQKEGSVGIRVTGGNQVGIFVTAVQPGSASALQGLVPGDKILKVNDMDMAGVTREEAVLFLLSLQDQIELVVQHKRDEYDQVVASGHGDSFYVKTHFNYEQPASGHMSFRKGEVFHVVDTLYKGVVGAWQAFRVGPNGQDLQQGVVPNSASAEELATAQFNAAKKEAATTTSESRGSFFRRRRPTHRRSKSLGRDHWDDVVFAETLSKFPAYERVVLRHPGFIRPVVFFGPIADIAREKLIKDFPDKFSAPQIDGNREAAAVEAAESGAPVATSTRSGIVRLSAIRELVEKGRHALLDITPGAVDKLNYAQFYPVVIFLRADSKHTVKELRAGTPKTAHKSSKKLYEQSVKLEKLWSHVFTTVVPLTQRDTWYRKLREAIDREQNQAIWISEAKLDEYLSDDFLFPMTSRLSYASSPESDLDLSPEPRPAATGAQLNASSSSKNGGGLNASGLSGKSASTGEGRLIKSSSDPSIATQDDLGMGTGHASPPPKFLQPLPVNSHLSNGAIDNTTPSKRRSHGGDSKYGFSPPSNVNGNGNGLHMPPGHQRDGTNPRSPRSNNSSNFPQQNSYPYSSPSSRGQPQQQQPDYQNGGTHQPNQRSVASSSVSSGYPPQKQGNHQFSSPHSYGPTSSSDLPPPKIDRSSKPSSASRPLRSAQERLFGSREGDINGLDTADGSGGVGYPHGTPNGVPSQHDYIGSLRGSSLDRERAAKAGSYDSSTSSYESYNRLGLTLSLAAAGSNNGHGGSGMVDPLMTGSPTTGGPPHMSSSNKYSSSSHDPYRYTRSTSQPVRSPTELTSPASKPQQQQQQQHRPFDNNTKPSPPPKSAPYKPVPPPKPKNYRPPPNVSATVVPPNQQQQPVAPNSNYWNHSPPGTLNHPSHRSANDSGNKHAGGYYSHGPPHGGGHTNGHSHSSSYRYEDDVNGGFDSGHGSSLDRHSYGGANSLYGKAPPPPPPVNGSARSNQQAGQYYYNIPPPREQSQSRDNGGRIVDLAQHRDQRGSAFELYKKPADPRSPGGHGHQQLYMEHNARLDYYDFNDDGDGCFSPSSPSLPYYNYHHYYHQQQKQHYSPPTSPAPPNCSVIATVRAWLSHERGGRLESVETGVALIVPPGALPASQYPHLVYFKVCRQDRRPIQGANGPPLDEGKGEALLSPLVQCGPKGLRFLQPVELRIPHAGGSRRSSTGKWNVSLKASNEMGQWREIDVPQTRGENQNLDDQDDDELHEPKPEVLEDTKNFRNHLSVFVDRF